MASSLTFSPVNQTRQTGNRMADRCCSCTAGVPASAASIGFQTHVCFLLLTSLCSGKLASRTAKGSLSRCILFNSPVRSGWTQMTFGGADAWRSSTCPLTVSLTGSLTGSLNSSDSSLGQGTRSNESNCSKQSCRIMESIVAQIEHIVLLGNRNNLRFQ